MSDADVTQGELAALASLGVVVTRPSVDFASLGPVPTAPPGEPRLSHVLASGRDADRRH